MIGNPPQPAIMRPVMTPDTSDSTEKAGWLVMPLSVPLAKMTTAQLEARIRIHLSTAEVFDRNNEPGMAKQFREMAEKYLAELAERG